MELPCKMLTHSSPEVSFKEFLDNVIGSLTGYYYNQVYQIHTKEQAVQTIMHVTSCPICSKATKLSAYDEFVVRYMKLEEGAKMPQRAHQTDIGWDMYSLHTIDLMPGQVTEVRTGIALEMPPPLYATFEGRSSYHFANVTTFRGIIDNGYRGEVSPFLVNHSTDILTVKKWERCAQLIFHYGVPVKLVVSNELSPSDRGASGFGSSGKF